MSTVVTEEITYDTQVTPNNLAKQGDVNVSTRPPVNQVKEERKDSLASDKDGDAKDEKDKEFGSSREDSVERPVGTVSYVGWKQVGGWEEGDRLTSDDLFTDAERDTMLSQVLPRSLYGDYYHSIGIFFIGGFLSFLLGYFKFNVGPVFFVILATSVLYRASIKKHRASVRDLVQKEMTVERVEDDYESMEWLNNFLDKFWPRLEPNLSKLILDQVNVELAKNPSVPGFIQALWVDQFTLGIKPPRIELVKTFQNTEPNITVMDWCVSFTPHDLNDLGAKQLKNYINQKIIVKAKMYGVTIPVFVNDVSFRTFLRIRMKMMTPFPHIETVNIQLLEVPDFDFVFKLFGDTIFNWELMSIPGLLPFAREMIKKYAGPLLLPPFSLQLNVPQLISESALSIGVLEINVREATKLLFPRTVLESEVINPYLEFEFNNTVVGRTKILNNSLAPVWNEKFLVLLGSFTDPLSVTVYSKREKLNDKIIGRVQYNLSSLQENHTQKECVAPILNNSKRIGDLIFDLNFHPTLEPKKLPDGTVEDLPDLNTGITKIVIEEGKFSNFGKEKATTSIEVFINAKSVLTTSVFKKDNKPKYKAEHEVIITDRRKTRVKLVVKDSKGNVISSTIQSLNDLIGRTQVDNEWIPLPGSKGELKVTTHWKPVALESGTDSAAYNPPIGVIRVFMNKAEDLRNLERIGKIDPYARVLVNGIARGRTDSKKSTLNPIWNQAIYIPITSPNQRITIECMDVETAGKDRTLGKFDVKANYLFEKGSDDKYVERIDEEPKVGKLVSKKGVKGTVSYYLSFYPALPVLTLEEILELDAINERKRQLGELKEAIKQKSANSEEKKKLEDEEQEIKELDDLYSNKMKLDVDELLQYPAGVFAFNVLGGEMPQAGTYLQVFFDSEGYPSASSSKYATKTVRQGTSGDSMIKGLQWSVTTFRATKNSYQNKAEDCLCEIDVPTIELVRNCYYKPSIVTLRGNSSAKIMLQVSWFPILVSKIPQVDLISNTGDLEIVFHSANRLIASDRNGKSDPYVKIYLDDSDESIYKTKTKKKTLDPVWEESTQLEISNRVNNYLKIRVMDWDAGNADDLIGTATVPLADVNPGTDTYMDVPLTGPNNEDGGVLHLTFRFAPRHVVSVSKVETKVGDLANKGLSAGLHAGTSVIGTGLGAVGKLKKGILGGGKKKDKDDQYE